MTSGLPEQAAGGRGVALVTGGGTGIGYATAVKLVDAGFDVAMAGLEPAPLGGLPCGSSAEGVGRSRYYQFDLAVLDAHDGLLDAVEADFGPINCLVNNAGVTSLVRGDLLDLSPESFDRTVAVNLRGTFFLSQAVARRFLSAKMGQPGSPRSIITVSSVNAEIVGENRGDYCMTKAGLTMMTKLFASRLAEANVAVFEIRPGIIATDMTAVAAARYTELIEAGGVPATRWGEPEDVARAIVTLARGDIPFATGIHVDIAGGLQLHRV